MFLRAFVLFCGLSMDSCIEIMEKGATLKEVNWKQNILYPLMFALVNMLFLGLGYLLAYLLSSVVVIKTLAIVAIVILICEGVYFLKKGFSRTVFIEKLDRNFNYQTCLKKAALTSIDNFLCGISLSLIGVSFNEVILFGALLSFVIYVIGIRFGYTCGARWQKGLDIIEGICLIAYAIIKLMGSGLW
ncbi:MAG: manganese efflux pump MntP family protein [Erysipelotrichaceae bacterium]|nr:manganese efflux pump MntP family protein [Erysipelotrichaceae bacterium]MDY5252088.1 manganese efflux pump [Erysipelotrichaceae bacterium]